MSQLQTATGAVFSPCETQRFLLWRIWEAEKPKVLFIGLNPSVANTTQDDPTTKRIRAHAKRLGFGGVYLGNCFPTIATDPKLLHSSGDWQNNRQWIMQAATLCEEVVFAWGRHPLVKELGRDRYFANLFPHAKQLGRNLDGSPKHPLYLPYSTVLERFQSKSL